MPITYFYTDPATGDRVFQQMDITKLDSVINLTPPGHGVSITAAIGNYTVGDTWNLQETLINGGNHNLLDQVLAWRDALIKDNTVQDYFETVPGINNSLSSKGNIQVSGEWDNLKYRAYEFSVGSEAQTSQNDQTLLAARGYSFTVDADYAGGIPSPENPMVLYYQYNDGGVQTGQVVITGVGPDYAVNLNPPGEGTNFYLVNADFAAGDTFTFASGYDPTKGISITNPMPLTYTYRDDNDVRQVQTILITDPKSVINLLPPTIDPEGNLTYGATMTLSADAKFDYNDSFNLSLEQYARGQTASQEFLEEIAALHINLLKYTGDSGTRLNNLEIRLSFMGVNAVWVDTRLRELQDTDIAEFSERSATLQLMYKAMLQNYSSLFAVSLADYI